MIVHDAYSFTAEQLSSTRKIDTRTQTGTEKDRIMHPFR